MQLRKEAFIEAVTSGLSNAPAYFAVNAKINQEGYENIDHILRKGLTAISTEDFKLKMKEDVTILDTRNATLFTEGFIPGSVSIGLEGRFAEWAGSLLSFEKPILLITQKGKEIGRAHV